MLNEIATLKAQLKVAKLRSKRLWFTYKVPDEFRRNRTGTAYDSGYEAGWRGWDYSHGYTRSIHQRAYLRGFNDAIQQLRDESKS